ncbi:hypothetical protein KIH07_02565 [Hydrogenophaga taeniospiralis]|uniref:sulfatase-like hydrolase/transferase n=1 Tax=Hydrogenophaga taeniospiralis TaxID=65656 RepID=UPI001CF9EFE0|nr:sulfatase-like hydrolase/transferase [Hydrogenophaga taeniospiralis]MCB4362600.1 hypothetical protein [Hydrogenophaga taeniospiralis]
MSESKVAWHRYLLLLAIYALLGLLFQGLSLYFGYKRHLFSAEMLLAFFLLAAGLRFFGVVAFIFAVASELSLGMSSIFYLFELGQIWDMAEFLFEARPSYLASLVLLIALMAAGLLLSIRTLKGLHRSRHLLLQIMVALGLFQYQWVLSAEEQTFFSPTFADRMHLLFGSSVHFARDVMVINKGQAIGNGPDDAEYIPIQYPSAAKLVWGQKQLPPRVLFIIAESWGQPKDLSILEGQIQALRQSPHVKDLTLDRVHAVGATAAGELREMCGMIPTRLNFRKLTAEAVGDCLPAQLRKQGYSTIGIHGAHGFMYRRLLWWPEIGLKELIFKEALPQTKPLCHSFPGYCDRHLFDIVRNRLSAEKVFLYWLTLNSHMPYDRRDVVDYREELCRGAFGAAYDEQLCNYQNLHVQFFEHLAKLAEDESMRGVEVVVVGDHAPIFNDEASRGHFERKQVSMLHFTLQ